MFQLHKYINIYNSLQNAETNQFSVLMLTSEHFSFPVYIE